LAEEIRAVQIDSVLKNVAAKGAYLTQFVGIDKNPAPAVMFFMKQVKQHPCGASVLCFFKIYI